MQINVRHVFDKDNNLNAVQISFDDWAKIDKFFWASRQEASEQLKARTLNAFDELLRIEADRLPTVSLENLLAAWDRGGRKTTTTSPVAPYAILIGSAFEKEVKRLSRKYPSLYNSLAAIPSNFQNSLGTIKLDNKHLKYPYGLRSVKQSRSGGQIVVVVIMSLEDELSDNGILKIKSMFLADIYATAEQDFIEPIYEHLQLTEHLKNSWRH